MARLTRQLETEQSAAERHSEALQHQLSFLQSQISAKRAAYMALAAATASSDVAADAEPAVTAPTSSTSLVAAALSSVSETESEGGADSTTRESSTTIASLHASEAAATAAPPHIGFSNESDMLASLDALYASLTTVEETKPLLAYLANQVVVWKRKRIASARETSEMHERLEQCQQQAMDAQHRIGAIKLEADRRLMEQQVAHEREKRQLMLELQGLSEEWARTGGVSSGVTIAGADTGQFTVYHSDAAIDSHDWSAAGKASHHHSADVSLLSSSRIGRPSRRLRAHAGADAAPSAFSGVARVGGNTVPLLTGASAPPFLPSSHSGNAFLGPLSSAASVGGGMGMGGIIGVGSSHLGPFNPAALERLITPTVSSQNKLKTHEVAAGSRRRPPPTIANLVASSASGFSAAAVSAASTAEADAAAVANFLPAVFHRLASSDTVVSAARKRSDSQDRSQQPSASALIASRGIAAPGLHAVSGQCSGVATLATDATLSHGSSHVSPVFGATASSPSTPTAAFALGRGSFDDGLDSHADHLASDADGQSQTHNRSQHSQFAHMHGRLPDEPLRSRASHGSLASSTDDESVGSARSLSRPHSSIAVSRASLDNAAAASIVPFRGAADDGPASGAEFDSFSAIGNAVAMASQHVSHATRLRTSNAHHHPSRGNSSSASASGSFPTWMQPTISSSNNNHQHAAGDEGRSDSSSGHSNRPAMAGASTQFAGAKSVVHDRLYRTKLESHKMAERPGTASATLSAPSASSASASTVSTVRGATVAGAALARPASARERSERPSAHRAQSLSHAGDPNLALLSMHAGVSRKPKSHIPTASASAFTAGVSVGASAAVMAPSSDSSDDDSSACSSAAASARGPSLATLEMMFADIASSGRDGPSPPPNHSAAEHTQHDNTSASSLATVSHVASEAAGSVVALSVASLISPDFQLETYFSPPPAPLVRALSRLRSSSASRSPSAGASESDENTNAVIGNYSSSQHYYTPRTHEATSAASGSSPSPLPLSAESLSVVGSAVCGSAVKSRFGVDSSMQMRESELASMMTDFEQSLKIAPRRE
jgi:hypothetical protein